MMTTVRLLLAFVAAWDWELDLIDIRTAFLNADTDKEIFVKQPPGYHQGATHMVYRLLKALYGLKQAGRLEADKLIAILVGAGAKQSTADPCPFVFQDPVHGTIYVLFYVDDVLVAAATVEGVAKEQVLMDAAVDMRNLGGIKRFLGMKVIRDRTARRST